MAEPPSLNVLRLRARNLEAQLDKQMDSYRKLVFLKSSAKVDKAAQNDMESSIDMLLKQLEQLISQMHAWVSPDGSDMISDTLNRHQQVFQNLSREFRRLHHILRAKQGHAPLIQDFREFDRTRLDLENGVTSVDQALFRERPSFSQSTGQVKSNSPISRAQKSIFCLVASVCIFLIIIYWLMNK